MFDVRRDGFFAVSVTAPPAVVLLAAAGTHPPRSLVSLHGGWATDGVGGDPSPPARGRTVGIAAANPSTCSEIPALTP